MPVIISNKMDSIKGSKEMAAPVLNYVLITAARNEEAYIGQTIQSVLRQTVLPVAWVIVSNGSVDKTDEIVQAYQKSHSFIQFYRTSAEAERNFGSKARAVNWGYERIRNLPFQFIGNLDADVTIEADYYEKLMKKFWVDSLLGLAGGVRYDVVKGHLKKVRSAENSVGGPTQFFRRECWEAINGYMALPYGGVDAIAEISARMNGWKVKTFTDLRVYHHRKTGSQGNTWWQTAYKAGIRAYVIGYAPIFQILRCIRRITEKPVLLFSLVWIMGYFGAAIRRTKRAVPPELIQFLRREQMDRLRLRKRVKII